ncbi:DsbA family protein [Streptomyces sp. NRRL B-1347]|uniref:DsbA family protein n=1 Tax=Streptomyces sp. NRRL B-1347 TaxID=1476877 RepID=UPI0004C7B14D|nr:thioredoxin domain-containing protein [Streptomyces sp. NRRL B-1347]
MRNARGVAAATAVGMAVLTVAGCGSEAKSTEGTSTGTFRPQWYAGVEELPEKLAADGTTIVVGDPAAATTVRLYEDPRCPVVEEFEATGAPALRETTLRRETKAAYTLASFRDDRVGGDGSKRAVNALRAALDAGKFTEYHTVLFAHMTKTELTGGYTTASLLKLAGQVKGLRSKTFDTAVKTMKYQDFVAASARTYEAAGGDDPRGPGTPTVDINDTRITSDGEHYGLLFEQTTFRELLNSAHSQPQTG